MTNRPRIHLTGASCSGVSTLGNTLSEQFGVVQLDVDDFYWMPTDPPFSTKRPPEERVCLIRSRQAEIDGWILTGSLIGWGDVLVQHLDLIVFIQTPAPIRLRRLDQREVKRHGGRILPGGDMHEAHQAFRDWASRYDDPSFSGRSLAKHELWLGEQPVPILRLQGEHPTEKLAKCVADELLRLQPCRS